MAILEKIREKKALTTILIGGALLAFILTMNSGSKTGGCTSQNTTLAEVDGEKIDYVDKFQELSNVQALLRKNTQSNDDADNLNQQMLNQLVVNTIIDQECEDAAITVGKEELSARMGITLRKDAKPGENPYYELSQAMRELVGYVANNLGQFTPAQIKDAAEKGTLVGPDGQAQNVPAEIRGALQKLWQSTITATEEEIKTNKVVWLVQECFTPNDFDRELVQEGMSAQYAVEYAQVNYTGDDKYNATDAEIKAEYDKLKEMFRIDDEQRAVHLILVPLEPSDKDLAESEKVLAKAVGELNDSTSHGFNALRNYDNFVKSEQNFYTTDGKLQSQPQSNDLAMTLNALATDSLARGVLAGNLGKTVVTPRMGTTANVYKLIDRFTIADSIMLDVVQIAGNKQYQDSVLALLNGGADPDSLVAKLGDDKFAVRHGEEPVRGYQIPDSLREKISSTRDFFIVVNTDEGALCWRVADVKAPVTFCEVAVAQYHFIPSDATTGKVQNELQKVLDKFKKAPELEKAISEGKDAQAKKYKEYLTEEILANTNSGLGSVPKTREIVKWVFNEAKVGDVSQIKTYSADNYHNVLVVTMLDEIYKDYLPETAKPVKDKLAQRVKARKEGEAIVKANKTNDVNAFASKAGIEVQADTVSFMGRTGNLAGEPRVVGFVAGAKKGASKQIVGDRSVVVVKVGDKINSQMAAMPKQMLTQQAMSTSGINNLLGIVVHSRKVKMTPNNVF